MQSFCRAFTFPFHSLLSVGNCQYYLLFIGIAVITIDRTWYYLLHSQPWKVLNLDLSFLKHTHTHTYTKYSPENTQQHCLIYHDQMFFNIYIEFDRFFLIFIFLLFAFAVIFWRALQ